MHDNAGVNPENVRDICKAKIVRYIIPCYVFLVPGYPLTGSGKIQKSKLREMALEICNTQGVSNI
jgi:fatty-acyl-CoA synthase